ncbi:hypothetical protein QE152_g40005 [Popillia japonica]|uniref:Uncharacterized protein n=1 Tax=Popillia japonica TaxID=7064 RepID=A0AAW1HSU8_POPJA
MEITEPETAKMLYEDGVNVADIESNNGGRGFARNVQAILKDKYKSNRCNIKPFHQSQNKQSRILSNSTWHMGNGAHIFSGELERQMAGILCFDDEVSKRRGETMDNPVLDPGITPAQIEKIEFTSEGRTKQQIAEALVKAWRDSPCPLQKRYDYGWSVLQVQERRNSQ